MRLGRGFSRECEGLVLPWQHWVYTSSGEASRRPGVSQNVRQATCSELSEHLGIGSLSVSSDQGRLLAHSLMIDAGAVPIGGPTYPSIAVSAPLNRTIQVINT